MPASPAHLLKSVFGFDEFKPLQREIIQNILEGRDSLVIMPTGGGKSLCYQLPSLIFDGLTLVVSPLISLMKDQVEQMTELGIPAIFLNSSLSPDEYRANVSRLTKKDIRLLYMAPESLLSPYMLDILGGLKLSCLAIDEAHCISEWGHDFRPEYRQLVEVRKRFPKAVCIALTATATERVRQDIQESLGFERTNEFIASFNRENLFLEVAPKIDPLSQTLDILYRYTNQSGIIYCFSRRQVDDLAAELARRGFSVRPYHAGLTDGERKLHQEQFIRDDVEVIVATIAFGMGINKPNVRFVIHYDLPKNIESYYQEIGRAGRDGLPAHCLLLYSYGDTQKIRYFFKEKDPHEQQVANAHLQALVRYAETTGCRRTPLLNYFGEEHPAGSCETCDNCTSGTRKNTDLTIPAQKFLSCVKRTGERFGTGHIIDVLHGSSSEKVLRNRHNELTTYGIGKDYTKEQWQYMARQFIDQGLLTQEGEYGVLKLSPKAYAVFRGEELVWGSDSPPTTTRQKRRKGTPEYDAGLFELLRAERKRLADQARVPPYVIFSDRSLIEMAAYFPASEKSMLNLHGIGQVKLEKYGQAFLKLIQTYSQRHGRTEKPKTTTPMEGQLTSQARKPRHVVVAEAYNNGQTVDELMAEYQVKEGTILAHLERYLSGGGQLRQGNFIERSKLSPEQLAVVLQSFADHGAGRMKPVFEALEETVSYDALRLVRLHLLVDNGSSSPLKSNHS